jgi:iron complex outermembrane receptor protein
MATLPARIGRSFAFAFATGTFSCTGLLGQSAPAAAEETIRLSPFSVESRKDYGYRATNSVTATGSGEPIVNTPISISVLTEDFIKDKNLTELRDAVRFVTGTSSDYQQIFGRGFTSIIKLDGLEVSSGGTGDFMSYTAERVEVVKGAVSVLQGRASAGGVVNVLTRRPKFYRATDIVAGFGSFERKFGQFRSTGPLVDQKLAYAFNYTKLDTKGWVDRTTKEDDTIQFGLTYRPTDRLELFVNYEKTDRTGYPEQHLTFTHPDFLAAQLEAERLYDARGIARPAQFPQVNEATATWLTRRGYPADTPTEVVNINELMYPRGYRANIQGTGAYEQRHRDQGFVEAQYRFSDNWNWRSVYYQYNLDYDFARRGTFRPVANIGGFAISDRAQMGLNGDERENMMHELVGRFSTWKLNHRTLAGYEYRKVATRSLTLNGPATDVTDPRSTADYPLVARVLGANPNGFNLSTPYSTSSERSYYVVDQMNAFDERLFVFAGARRTEAKQSGLVSTKTVPQFGALARVPGVKGLSIFGTYGESFRPNFIPDGYGRIVPPTLESNTEVGLKFDMFDGKISGSASTYEIDQTNVPLRDFAAEAATGVRPLYILAGEAKSAGAEFDLVLTPVRNYQAVLGYSRIWEARTLAAGDVRQVGVRLNGAPEYTAHIWNKYTFTQGPARGLYVGFGVRFIGEIHVHPSWSAPVYNEPFESYDALIGYRTKLGGVETDFSLRADNLMDKFYYDQSFRPGSGRSLYFSTRLHF